MPKRILVVEDDTDQSLVMELVLRFGGYSVVPAADGAQALAYAKHTPLSLVVLDMRLGEKMDGFDVLARLRDDPATAELPVLVLTAFASEAHHAKAVAMGADCYMAKPYVAADFIDRVKSCMRLHEK